MSRITHQKSKIRVTVHFPIRALNSSTQAGLAIVVQILSAHVARRAGDSKWREKDRVHTSHAGVIHLRSAEVCSKSGPLLTAVQRHFRLGGIAQKCKGNPEMRTWKCEPGSECPASHRGSSCPRSQKLKSSPSLHLLCLFVASGVYFFTCAVRRCLHIYICT